MKEKKFPELVKVIVREDPWSERGWEAEETVQEASRLGHRNQGAGLGSGQDCCVTLDKPLAPSEPLGRE